jgi:hypothetical protein
MIITEALRLDITALSGTIRLKNLSDPKVIHPGFNEHVVRDTFVQSMSELSAALHDESSSGP